MSLLLRLIFNEECVLILIYRLSQTKYIKRTNISLLLFCTTTTTTTFFFFFHCRSFSPCIGGRWHFSFCHRRCKFSCCFSNKKYLFVSLFLFLFLFFFFFFISRSRSPSRLFSLSFAGLPPTFVFFSLFHFLYIPNLWTWQLI